MEARTIRTTTGTTHKLWARFVSKATAMTLAAKHQFGEKVNLTGTVGWDVVVAGIPAGELPDEVEEAIEEVSRLPCGLKQLAAPHNAGRNGQAAYHSINGTPQG